MEKDNTGHNYRGVCCLRKKYLLEKRWGCENYQKKKKCKKMRSAQQMIEIEI